MSNNTKNIFERASRRPLRFVSPKGVITVEDLWALSGPGALNTLDAIAVQLYKKLQAADTGVSFRNKKAKPADEDDQLAFEIVTHILATREAEAETAAKAREKAENNQKIMALIARKKEGELEGKSVEELEKLLIE
jgi:hypothetical protein